MRRQAGVASGDQIQKVQFRADALTDSINKAKLTGNVSYYNLNLNLIIVPETVNFEQHV